VSQSIIQFIYVLNMTDLIPKGLIFNTTSAIPNTEFVNEIQNNKKTYNNSNNNTHHTNIIK
jgi:hypothetical protein